MAWCKSETRTPGFRASGQGTKDPTQSLKVGPGTYLKFKSEASGPPSKFKSGVPGPPTKFKSGIPHLSLMNSFFSEYFLACFYLFIFVPFLDKIQKISTVSNRNQ